MRCTLVGYNLYVISGIDGSFEEFSETLEKYLIDIQLVKISYMRSMSFQSNLEAIKTLIKKDEKKCVLLGWSIGGVLAGFLMECKNVLSAILINAFYQRSYVLELRNIHCDEQVCFSMAKKVNKKLIIIYGEKDEKIPFSESIKIASFYNLANTKVHAFPNAKHNLSSFPTKKLAQIINNTIVELEDIKK